MISIDINSGFLEEYYQSNLYECWGEQILPVMIESGTYLGSAVRAAMMKGVKEIHTIEIDKNLYDINVDWMLKTIKTNRGGCRILENQSKFVLEGSCEVNLYCGDSCEILPHILSDRFQKRAFFWLDGHVSSEENAAHIASKIGGPNPLLRELEAIAQHHIKNHTILIDDIETPEYVENRHLIVEALKTINPKYEMKFIPRRCFDQEDKRTEALEAIDKFKNPDTAIQGESIEEYFKARLPHNDSGDPVLGTVLVAYIPEIHGTGGIVAS